MRAAARYRMSFTSVDFPEPETPVTAVKTPSGKRTVRFLRLFSLAPTTVRNFPFPARLEAGRSIASRPRGTSR